MTARETLALLRLAIPLLWTKPTKDGRASRTPTQRKPLPQDSPKAESTTRSQRAHRTEGTRPKKPPKQGAHR
jgi:hypothetical protein